MSFRLSTLVVGWLLAAAPAASAQLITDVQPTEGTLGTIVRLHVLNAPLKPKLALIQDGLPAKPGALKLVDSGSDEGGDWLDVRVAKAGAGTFQLGFVIGKQVVGLAESTFTVLGPDLLEVSPASAAPKDLVDALVDQAGEGKRRIVVAGKTGKIVAVNPAAGDGGNLSDVSFRVPAVPNGIWHVRYENPVGSDTLKAALEVTDSKLKHKPQASLQYGEGKPLRTPGKQVELVPDEAGFAVVVTFGPKKAPKVLRITIPEPIADVEAGDLYTELPANIELSETTKQGVVTEWAAEPADEGNGWRIDIIEKNDERLAISVCGTLTPDLPIEGTVVADLVVKPSGGCTPGASGEVEYYPDFVADGGNYSANFGISGPNTTVFAFGDGDGEGTPGIVFSIHATFNPHSTPVPVTYDSLTIPAGTGMTHFSSTQADTTAHAAVLDPITFIWSASITVLERLPPIAEFPFSEGRLRGTIQGNVHLNGNPMEPAQAVSVEFCVPWYTPTSFP